MYLITLRYDNMLLIIIWYILYLKESYDKIYRN